MRYHVVRSGQPRPYADSELVVRLQFDEPVTEEQARAQAREASVGYTDVTKKDREGWWSRYLDYFRALEFSRDEKHFKEWEFKVVTPFTD